MKDIKQFLNEAKEYTSDSKVRMGDSAELASFLKNEIEGLEGSIKVTGDGIKYNNMLVPDTKLSLGITAGEYVDRFINWYNDLEDKKANAKPLKVRKRKDNSWKATTNGKYTKPRDGEKEAKDAEERNREVIGH